MNNNIKFMLIAAALATFAANGYAEKAVATMGSTQDYSAVQGTVRFEDAPEGIKVTADLVGVPRGPHGFHIHEVGSCGKNGEEAGEHYNPFNHPHGNATKDVRAHPGDLGNIVADRDGKATFSTVLPNLTLTGTAHNILGRAVVVHEKPDDFSQPSGNAGKRIACGVIIRED